MTKIQPVTPEMRRKAYSYILQTKNNRGYMKDLKAAIGENVAEEFKAVGFINTGNTKTAETYSVSKLGKMFSEEISMFDVVG